LHASRNGLTGTHLLNPFNDDQLCLFETAGHDDFSALLDTSRCATQFDLFA
jgi:hypothetical protein